MACATSLTEEVLHTYRLHESKTNNSSKEQQESKRGEIISLKRGGLVVKTKLGWIQFGIPPETVKDSLNLGIQVPTYYVVPSVRFDKKTGINVAEFEFPAYFNYFVKKKKINLICSKEAYEAIGIIFQETLLGPKEFDYLPEEFYHTFDESSIPNFKKELEYFAKTPSGDPLTVEHLLDFTIFDNSGFAYITDGLAIKKSNETFLVLENNEEIASIPDKVNLGSVDMMTEEVNTMTKTGLFSKLKYEPLSSAKKNVFNEDISHFNFNPPIFGVTVLGASHGFDPKGSVSGYIIWINGRGVMVDPPPFSSQILRKLGIPSILIEWIIISHCHADHDAGTFQKILDATRVEIITTKTILDSFVRKYSALSGMSVNIIQMLFKFRPVIIGAPLSLNGATFRFFYSLHSIPCIGFEVFLQDKSIFFSGDTFFDPKKMLEMHKNGYLSKRRYESLANIKWIHTVILHEAGVPPIHTPLTTLSSLPSDVKNRIFLVHVAEKDVKPDMGLKTAQSGLENTIVIDVQKPDSFDYLQKMDVLSSIEVFEGLSLRNVRDLLHSANDEYFSAGQIVIKEGTLGHKFYIILKGVARIYSDKPDNRFERLYNPGEYFGESSLNYANKNNRRMASVQAITDLHLLAIERHDFWFAFGDGKGGGGPIINKLLNLFNARKSKALSVIIKNSALSELNASQKTQLEMILEEEAVKKDEMLWKVGDEASFAIMISKGRFKFVDCGETENEFETGAFIGEIEAMLNATPLTTTLISVTDGYIFKIGKANLLAFLNRNPGLFILFAQIKYFE